MDFRLGKDQQHFAELGQKFLLNKFLDLCRKKNIPDIGWDENILVEFLTWLSRQDSNNQLRYQVIGAGEREGRISCSLVGRLHFNMTHGIGRSGNILDSQPKAQGSTIINMLANALSLEALHIYGLKAAKGTLVVPLCTGASISLCLSGLRNDFKEKNPNINVPRYVIWMRADQMSAPKAIINAGFDIIVVEPIPENKNELSFINREIFCIISCTQCFAPREPDDIIEISRIAKATDVYHIVNNAYGVAVTNINENFSKAASSKDCRIDAIVQSLDKNFQTPVGGSVIATLKQKSIIKFAKSYPGRASAIPSRDFVLTMLNQGVIGLKKSLILREELYVLLRNLLTSKIASKYGEKVLASKNTAEEGNGISMCMTLSSIKPENQSLLGSMLFHRGVTGSRVVPSTSILNIKKLQNYELENYFSHSKYSNHGGYINFAVSIGMKEAEVYGLIDVLDNVLSQLIKKS
ncbi:O-phosphoseryl-tRNA(Sec) selenium transferase [Strongyloides ratti]|uniref:O-phosphoseryl-tRNA(Sec) selenium transferase n=1 Tax=Strongyloides ratti TaxID=34506 RepID=A0A090LAV2_STRRB|nr:O-phosphoseryl-tRNA(Sec) selenium transferase [Strongyloides ratti]CEF66887.1 O-phosphoseryl-tRNA(Sec) selenium transferase [Strongyloides ratti]